MGLLFAASIWYKPQSFHFSGPALNGAIRQNKLPSSVDNRTVLRFVLLISLKNKYDTNYHGLRHKVATYQHFELISYRENVGANVFPKFQL
jgi:hypothetical protein